MTEVLLGGIRKHLVDLLRGLRDASYDVTLAYSAGRMDPLARQQLLDLARRGVRIVEIPMPPGLRPLAYLGSLARTVRLLRLVRPDILHCHAAKAGALGRIAARLAGVRNVVYTPHGGSFHRFAGLRGRAYLAVERFLVTSSTQFIGVSTDSYRAIREHLRVRDSQVHLVHNGISLAEIDDDRRRGAMTRRDLGVPDDRFVVLYPALFLEMKGHLEFLSALERSEARLRPEVVILLAGEGPLQSEIARRVAQLGVSEYVHFLGFQRDLFRFYRICDLVLLPSQAEAFPYVPLEAMACSKGIIATRVGGMPEAVVHGHNGELVAPDRLAEVVGRLNYYAEHRDEAARLGRNGRAMVEQRFALGRMIADTIKVYRAALHHP